MTNRERDGVDIVVLNPSDLDEWPGPYVTFLHKIRQAAEEMGWRVHQGSVRKDLEFERPSYS